MPVFPVHNNQFRIGINGRTSDLAAMRVIRDLETFSPSIDANTEEWTPMDTAGWIRRAVTGKGLTFSFSGKRNYGDPGNDYVAQTLLGTGTGVESRFEWVMPDGSLLNMDCILSLTTPAGGDSINVDNLEFELLSDGLPAFTAIQNRLTFSTVIGTTVGRTRVATVTPTLTGGNSYRYALNVAVPAVGTVATTGWIVYTLGTDVIAAQNDLFVLVEINASNVVQRVGQALSMSRQ